MCECSGTVHHRSWCSITISLAAFMAIDKLHWLPIHSLMLMFDQFDCRPIF